MIESVPVAGYGFLGRVSDSAGAPVGTCFQVEPRILVTAFHVLAKAGTFSTGDVVKIGPVTGGRLQDALVVRTDEAHDLAVLCAPQPLADSVPGLALSDGVATGEEVKAAGYAQVEDDGHEYALLPAGGKWRGPVLRDNLLWARMQADAVMPGMSGAPVMRVSDGHVVGVISARYRSSDEFMIGSVWVARVEDLVRLFDGVAQLTPDRLGPHHAVHPAARELHHSSVPPVPPHVFLLALFSFGLTAAAAMVGFRYGEAPALMILSPVLVSLFLSVSGLMFRWWERDSRCGLEVWAFGTVLLVESVHSGMRLSPTTPGRGLTILLGVPAFWMAVPIGLRLFLGITAGVLRGPADRWLVAAAFWLGTTASAVMLVTRTPVPACENWCGRSPVQLVDDPRLYLLLRSILLLLMVAAAMSAPLVHLHRIWRSTAAERARWRHFVAFEMCLVFLFCAYSLAAVSFYFGPAESPEPWDEISLVLGWSLAVGLPILLTIVIGRRHVQRFRLQNLADQAPDVTLGTLEQAIGGILRDPGFRILRGCPPPQAAEPGIRTPIPGTSPELILVHDPIYAGDDYLLGVIGRLARATVPR